MSWLSSAIFLGAQTSNSRLSFTQFFFCLLSSFPDQTLYFPIVVDGSKTRIEFSVCGN